MAVRQKMKLGPKLTTAFSLLNLVVKEKFPGCKKSEAAPYKFNCASHVWPIQHYNVQADNSSTALLAFLYPGGVSYLLKGLVIEVSCQKGIGSSRFDSKNDRNFMNISSNKRPFFSLGTHTHNFLICCLVMFGSRTSYCFEV